MTIVGKALVDSLLNMNENWTQGNYTIENKKAQISIWTSNLPIIDTKVYYPENVYLSWHDEFCIYFAIQKRNQMNLLKRLEPKKQL